MQYLTQAEFGAIAGRLRQPLEGYCVGRLRCSLDDAEELASGAIERCLVTAVTDGVAVTATAEDVWAMLCDVARRLRRGLAERQAMEGRELDGEAFYAAHAAGLEAPLRDRETALAAIAECVSSARGEDRLTALQEYVLRQRIDGWLQREIAEHLGISQQTVQEHAARGAEKVLLSLEVMRVTSREALEVYAEIQREASRSIYHAPTCTGAALTVERLRALTAQDQRHAAMCRRKRAS